MKREFGIARCGLACCLCLKNTVCRGCHSEECRDKDSCENRICSMEKGIAHCYDCDTVCRKGLLQKAKPYAFTLFAKRYGVEQLLLCLEENEKKGIIYHREGLSGDYDGFEHAEELIEFIKTGRR